MSEAYKCDVCGRLREGNKSMMVKIDELRPEVPTNGTTNRLDICSDCAGEFSRILNDLKRRKRFEDGV
jgi:hypothetical protein